MGTILDGHIARGLWEGLTVSFMAHEIPGDEGSVSRVETHSSGPGAADLALG